MAEPLRHAGEELSTVLSPINAVLLVLDDEPSEQPVPHDQRTVNGADGRTPCLLMRTPAQFDQALEIELPTHTGSPIRFKWPATFAP